MDQSIDWVLNALLPTPAHVGEMVLSGLGTVITQPMLVTKTLVMHRYEPVAPVAASDLLGRPVLKLPNGFTYARWIWKTHGVKTLFTGLGATFTSNLAGEVAGRMLGKVLAPFLEVKPFRSTVSPLVADDYLKRVRAGELEPVFSPLPTTFGEHLVRFGKAWTMRMATMMLRVAISYPAAVVRARMIAQIAGGETIYTGTVQSLVHIARREGFCGLFAGLQPSLLSNAYLVTAGLIVPYVLECIAERRDIAARQQRRDQARHHHGGDGDEDEEVELNEHDGDLDEDDDHLSQEELQELHFQFLAGEQTRRLYFVAIEYLTQPLGFALSLVSSTMKLAGSELALAPKPRPATWQECWRSLSAEGWTAAGLLRGNNLVWRTIPVAPSTATF
ncbi:hypothetical protein CAOG_09183 [Capsaspora owczarzaki ATCC 30864]|uniref:Mitochondrial carrier protein n=1 Tax=Capsaspora owczarzaki (strain ATCC 30864) TaxID=595528 RepID=A0A0D2WXZ5_CAPO3|nr:hypothetical protein CAOG_09183 [Capsaspora owczarzaki ATCC 30864]KJE98220.1 hypothetical protein CAOG_009183 [Capsaspora owczarzaki ATCC 30864]|eukprot:XP_011270900.1 hypothetical protein CAOG_09183 [Capsaspora owczarzaki ATCC 30864]